MSLTYRYFENRSGRKEQTLTPEVRWQIRPGLLAIARYSFGTEETEIEERDINVFSTQLQFSFR